MEASILTIDWPKDFDMLDPKAFETEARARRYQALGRACRDHKIQAVMVAHHGDDQAETVLMRLANNRLRTGLKGMLSVEWIPECEGIYGVHHSGKQQRPDTSIDIPFPVEQGGIRVLRPLLAMEKARLIATCEEQRVHWAEDKTNQNQTYTSRNAIRHIYNNHKLPEALSIPSLVNTALYMQKRIAEYDSYADRLYNKCLIKLDIQTGALVVRFPPFNSLLSRPIQTAADKTEARSNAYCLIEKVAKLVTPKPKPILGQVASRIDSIYPEFMTPEEHAEVAALGESHFLAKFTVYHVMWRRWDKASLFEDNGLPSEDFGSTPPHSKEWLLTRQTLESHELKKQQLTIPPSQTLAMSSDSFSEAKETYQLFDGRFWIRLRNQTHDTLILRHFERADMHHLPTIQNNKQAMQDNTGPIPERFITAALAILKPSDIRFTLPAVFRMDSTTGEETPIGFPTLNVHMHGFGAPEGVCDWSVRYKKVEFGKRLVDDLIVPGIKKADIIAQEERMRMESKGISRLKVRRNQVVDAYSQDSFTGYKRVSGNSAKKNKKKRLMYTQRAMEGEEIEGLGFLEDESEAYEDEKKDRKSDGRKGGNYTSKARDRWG
jgi:tRNA(Ile)-lysidine synthase